MSSSCRITATTKDDNSHLWVLPDVVLTFLLPHKTHRPNKRKYTHFLLRTNSNSLDQSCQIQGLTSNTHIRNTQQNTGRGRLYRAGSTVWYHTPPTYILKKWYSFKILYTKIHAYSTKNMGLLPIIGVSRGCICRDNINLRYHEDAMTIISANRGLYLNLNQ